MNRAVFPDHKAAICPPAAWVVALIAVAGVAGCGSGSSSSAVPASSVTARALLGTFRGAFVDFGRRDANGFCGDFTPRAAKRVASDLRGRSCEAAVERLFVLGARQGAGVPSVLGSGAKDFSITRVKLNGDRATATLRVRLVGGPGSQVHFRKVDGRWRIAEHPHVTSSFGCRSHVRATCGVVSLSIA
jgi:hypothetical protein